MHYEHKQSFLKKMLFGGGFNIFFSWKKEIDFRNFSVWTMIYRNQRWQWLEKECRKQAWNLGIGLYASDGLSARWHSTFMVQLVVTHHAVSRCIVAVTFGFGWLSWMVLYGAVSRFLPRLCSLKFYAGNWKNRPSIVQGSSLFKGHGSGHLCTGLQDGSSTTTVTGLVRRGWSVQFIDVW